MPLLYQDIPWNVLFPIAIDISGLFLAVPRIVNINQSDLSHRGLGHARGQDKTAGDKPHFSLTSHPLRIAIVLKMDSNENAPYVPPCLSVV